MSSKKKQSPGTIAVNKKARHLYELSEFLEAGISLTGPEIKSIRLGRVSFQDAYVEFRQGSAFVVKLHIAPYENAGYAPRIPTATAGFSCTPGKSPAMPAWSPRRASRWCLCACTSSTAR